jgi:hypothetical protein
MLPNKESLREKGYKSRYRIKFYGGKYTIEKRYLLIPVWFNPLKYRDGPTAVIMPPNLKKYSWFTTEEEAYREYNTHFMFNKLTKPKPTYKYI